MHTIRLEISDIEALKKKIARLSDDLDECYRDVSGIASDIDMKVKRKRDVDNRLSTIKTELSKQKNFLDECSRLIGESINEFVEAEKIDRLPEMNFSINSSGAGSGGGSGFSQAFSDFITGAGLATSAALAEIFSAIKNPFSKINISSLPQITEYLQNAGLLQSDVGLHPGGIMTDFAEHPNFGDESASVTELMKDWIEESDPLLQSKQELSNHSWVINSDGEAAWVDNGNLGEWIDNGATVIDKEAFDSVADMQWISDWFIPETREGMDVMLNNPDISDVINPSAGDNVFVSEAPILGPGGTREGMDAMLNKPDILDMLNPGSNVMDVLTPTPMILTPVGPNNIANLIKDFGSDTLLDVSNTSVDTVNLLDYVGPPQLMENATTMLKDYVSSKAGDFKDMIKCSETLTGLMTSEDFSYTTENSAALPKIIGGLLKPQTVTADLGGELNTVLTSGHDVGGVLNNVISSGHDVGAVLNNVTSVGHDVGAVLNNVTSVGHDVGAVLNNVTSVGHDIGGIFEEAYNTSHSIGSALDTLKEVVSSTNSAAEHISSGISSATSNWAQEIVNLISPKPDINPINDWTPSWIMPKY